jgi:hypothetical protein
MAFDFGAGLAEAGKSVAQTAQAYTLERQRADLDKEKAMLIDQLAGAREEKQRGFQTSERVATQEFTGGENDKSRSNAVAIANISADASVKSAGIHAGATIGAAQISAASHLDGLTKQIAAQYDLQQSSQTFQSGEKEKDRAQQKPLIDVEVLQKQVKTASEQGVLDARKELQGATEANDPAKIEAAKQKLSIAEYTSKDDFQQVAVYQTQARLIETQLTASQARLVALQNNVTTSSTPEGQAALNAMQRQVNKLQADFDGAISMSRQAIGRLTQVGGNAPTTTAPDLSKYMKPPASLPMPQRGLIDTPANP